MSVSLTVAPALDYEEKLKSQTLKSGSTLIIHVNYTGIPRPTITWLHNGEVLNKSEGTSWETTDAYTTLTIKGAGADNSGEYTVKAENVVDSVSADFTVVIKGEWEEEWVV